MKHIIALSMGAMLLAACSAFNPTPSTYIVFFGTGGTTLTPEARTIVDQAATAIKRTNPSMVAISTGVLVGDNLRLAEPRFAAIQKALIEDGVSPNIIARASIPDGKEDATTALANQRAEILLFQR